MIRNSLVAVLSLVLAASAAQAQTPSAGDAPQIGQVSKDSVWVPTPWWA